MTVYALDASMCVRMRGGEKGSEVMEIISHLEKGISTGKWK